MDIQACTESLRAKVGASSGLDAILKFDCGAEGLVYIDGRSLPNSVSNENQDTDCTIGITLENLTAMAEGKQIHVRFRANDSFSPIKRAEYSLDGGDWQFVEPVGRLSDSKMEDYDFRVAVPQPQATPPLMENNTGNDHVVVVRAYDRFDNLATAKTVIRGK